MKVVTYSLSIFLLLTGCSEMEIKWAKKFDASGPGNYRINSLYFHHDIYMTGSYWETGQNPSCITARFNENGELEWFNVYKQETPKIAEGKSILVIKEDILESSPDVYVLVHSVDAHNIKNVILVKYDSLGTIEWEKYVEESAGEIETEIVAADQNNIYITGWKKSLNDSITIFLAQYHTSGELVWLSEYYNPAFHFSQIKFDTRNGKQFLVGGIIENTGDFFFMRYDNNGNLISLTKYETSEHEDALAAAKIDNNGNVYLTGTIHSDETGNDYLTVVYDKDNIMLWSKPRDGEAHLNDIPKAMVPDDSLNVYVTGSSETQNGFTEILTIKYDQYGNELWSETFQAKKQEPVAPLFMLPNFIHYDRHSSVRDFYIAGYIGNDVLVLKYNTKGIHKWTARYGKADTNKPTAFSGTCIAMESTSEKGLDAYIIKCGPSEQ
ncbi:MAG: hypothetical protein JSV97_09335, partial [candidate division WOR-3 bacterium]